MQTVLPPTLPRRDIWIAAVVIVGAVVAAYGNSFAGVFVFDDQLSIVENASIRHLWPPWGALSPPSELGTTVAGRPLLNLSLAGSYALAGGAPAGFHVVNLLIHVVAALALFGLVRRTLARPVFDSRIRETALPLSAAVALWWGLHPLQTESVTYLVQRAESQMGMFYLVTLYCFARGIDEANRTGWYVACAVACWLGAGTKEVIASAPVLALLYDRALVAGTFRAAWRARRAAYLGLFSSWVLVAALVIGAGSRGGTVGFGSKVGWWDYALTQCEAITRYVTLSVWPRPLIFDYGVEWYGSIVEVAPQALLVMVIVAGTIFGLVRGTWWGFLGGWFLAMLAPTSLIPGNRQTIAEHRMYLSLAAPVALAVVGLHLGLRSRWRRTVGVTVGVAVVLGGLTWRRNEDYHSVLALYRDTVAKRPGNGHAHYNLAKLLVDSGQPAEAVPECEAAIRIMPGNAGAQLYLGNAYTDLGRLEDAARAFAAAARIAPAYVKAHYNLGNTLVQLGRREEAAKELAETVRLAPDFRDARDNLGNLLMELGQLDEARGQFERVLKAQPERATARYGLGNVLFLQEDFRAAVAEYERALRADPAFEPARVQLAKARAALGGVK